MPGCYAGRTLEDDLEVSWDFGSSFGSLMTPSGAYPRVLVGGSGAEPQRYYVAANKDFRSGGSLLLASPDDGAHSSTLAPGSP